MAGGALIGALRVMLGLDTAQFETGMRTAQSRLAGFQRGFATAGAALGATGAIMTAAVTAPFIALVSRSIPAAEESAQAAAQVNAALTSMGGASGRTSVQLTALAGHLQDISNFDDDDILRQVTANLLTFGNVSGTVFDQAQLAIVNLSTRLGTDLQAATIQVGRALNDPIRGLTALRRIGVAFTDEQKEQITTMVDAGNTAGAQAIILGELQREFGGAAQAMRRATPSADMQQQWRTFQENLGAVALRFLPAVNSGLSSLLRWFNDLPAGTQTTIVAIGAAAAALGPLLVGLGGVAMGISALMPVLEGVAGVLGAALAPEILLPIAAAVGAVYLAWQNWGTIGPMLQSAWAAIQQTLGPPLQQLMTAASGAWAAFRQIWTDTLGPALQQTIAAAREALTALWQGPFGDAIRAAMPIIQQFAATWAQMEGAIIVTGLVAFLTGLAETIRNVAAVLNIVAALLRGDWGTAWRIASAAVQREAGIVVRAIENLATMALGALQRLAEGVRTWLTDRINGVFDGVVRRVQQVGDAFHTLWDRVVGHSYVPDLVDGIAAEFARLDGVMVRPSLAATGAVSDAMRQLQQSTQGVLDRLFPDQARLRSLQDDMRQLDQSLASQLITREVWQEARRRLQQEIDGALADARTHINRSAYADNSDVADPLGQGSVGQRGIDMWEQVTRAANDNANRTHEATRSVSQSYAEMAKNVADSLSQLVGAIKGGNFFDILSQVARVAAQVIGAIHGSQNGGGIAGALAAFGGARAMGGGVSGGTSYLVGERGPELFVPRTGGTIVPNSALGGGGTSGRMRVEVVPSEYFNVRVTQIAGSVANDAVGSFAEREARARGRVLYG